MDPRPITDIIFKETYATLCLSGTLHPYTFSTLLGLNEKGKSLKIIKMKPPFPKENIKVILLEGMNTKGENRSDSMYTQMISFLKEITIYTPKNVGVFCASYDVLDGLLRNGFERMVKSTKKSFFCESPKMSAGENDILIEQYKAKSTDLGGVLLGVCGGRNSEGEDFPGDFMNAVVVVGVPFQRPTPSLNAKIAYYDKLFSNQGRLFAYTVPAIQRSNQACGRPIRRMDDRAFIVLMDNRFLTYKEYLSDWVKEEITILPSEPQYLRAQLQQFYPNLNKSEKI
jgi:DNA excision repair protein ERCC-2